MITLLRNTFSTCFSSAPSAPSNTREAAYIARHALTNIKLLKNKTNGTFKFGRFRDEISVTMCHDIPVVFFMGSDVDSGGMNRLIETAQEWISNAQVYFGNERGYFDEFSTEVLASLPDEYKTTRVVFVGYSRGGFLMSAFTSVVKPCAAIFVAAPGDYIDARKHTRRTYLFAHQLDPVHVLSLKKPVRAVNKVIFKGTKGEDVQIFAAKVHTHYTSWLKGIEIKPEWQDCCNERR
jgi:hypothetical protein